jgi:hypothetical protein
VWASTPVQPDARCPDRDATVISAARSLGAGLPRAALELNRLARPPSGIRAALTHDGREPAHDDGRVAAEDLNGDVLADPHGALLRQQSTAG